MLSLGKLFITAGGVLLLLGLLLLLLARTGIANSLPLGRLPGDLSYRGRNFSFFAPLGTSLLLSVLLSAILYLLARFRR